MPDKLDYKYNTPGEWLSDYAMGGKYDPKEVSPEVREFAKRHNFDIPKMRRALKPPTSKNKTVKVTKAELREMIREAVKSIYKQMKFQ